MVLGGNAVSWTCKIISEKSLQMENRIEVERIKELKKLPTQLEGVGKATKDAQSLKSPLGLS